MRYTRSWPFYCWIGFIVILLSLLAWQVKSDISIESNIIELLPKTEQNPTVQKALNVFSEQISKKILFLVGDQDQQRAIQLAQEFSEKLEASHLFRSVLLRQETLENSFTALYLPYSHELLTEGTRKTLSEPDGGAKFLQENTELLYSPMSSFYTRYIAEDPLLTFPRFLRDLPGPPGRVQLKDGVSLVSDGQRSYVIIAATTEGSPFSMELQDKVLNLVEAQEKLLKEKYPEAQLLYSGIVRFAAAGAKTTSNELNTLGTGSTIGVFLLVLLAFWSLREILLSALPIVVGLLAAFSFSYALFPRLHVLTICFGTSLIGLCMDFAFNFFVIRKIDGPNWDVNQTTTKLFPAISLAAFTSIVAFFALAFSPFPGLQQMGIFSAIGLIAAYLTAMCALPKLLSAPCKHSNSKLLDLGGLLVGFWQTAYKKAWWWCLFALLAVLSVLGIARIEPNDDIRLLQNPPKDLIANEKQIGNLFGRTQSARFLVLEAQSEERLLQVQEAIESVLRTEKENQNLDYYQSLASFLPSQARQLADYKLLSTSLNANSSALDSYLDNLGFDAERGKALIESLKSPEPKSVLTVDKFLSQPSSGALSYLWLGQTASGLGSIVLLGSIKDEPQFLNNTGKIGGVHYVDQVKSISDIFKRYRGQSVQLVAWAHLIILAILVWRYGFLKGLLALLTPGLAAFLSLGLLGLFTGTINAFHIISLILVLGIGLDYAIYFAEAPSSKKATGSAVILCALATIMSFGLLWWSETPVLSSLGGTLFIGISLSLFFSPLAALLNCKGGEN